MIERVYVSATGQEDNLGDSVLRRYYLEALRSAGARLHVLVRDHGDGYVTGLGLTDDDVIYRSGRAWRRSAFEGRRAGEVALGFFTGETQLRADRARGYLVDGALLRAVRAAGGRGVVAGAGVRHGGSRLRPLVRWMVAPCDVVAWRDARTADDLGCGVVAPDWAFAGGTPSALQPARSGRDTLVVSLRGDRPPPPPGWCEQVRDVARSADVSVTVVSQVSRDDERSRELGRRLDAATITFSSTDHTMQEKLVREVYARAIGAVSDRLHVLVLAATEGAVPVALLPAPNDKIERTLAAAGLVGSTVPMGHGAAQRAGSMIDDRERLRTAVDGARRRLADLTATIATVLR